MAMQAQQIQDQDWVEVRTRFGTLPVNKANLLDFPKGLPGFEELHQFVLLHDEDNTSVFYLQSTEDPAIRLPLSSPHWFKVDYEIGLSDEECALLGGEPTDELAVLVTVTDDGAGGELHANFNGPIILNTDKRTGLQKTLHGARSSLLIQSD